MRWKYVLPALYLALALNARIDFAGTAEDGYGALELMLVALPVSAVGGVSHFRPGQDRLCAYSQRAGLLHGSRGVFLAIGSADNGSPLRHRLISQPAVSG